MFMEVHSMTFAQRQYRLTTRFSERITVVKRRKYLVGYTIYVYGSTLFDVRTTTISPNDAFLRTYPRR